MFRKQNITYTLIYIFCSDGFLLPIFTLNVAFFFLSHPILNFVKDRFGDSNVRSLWFLVICSLYLQKNPLTSKTSGFLKTLVGDNMTYNNLYNCTPAKLLFERPLQQIALSVIIKNKNLTIAFTEHSTASKENENKTFHI